MCFVISKSACAALIPTRRARSSVDRAYCLMQPFIYTTHPVRVIFGFGTLAQLPAEVERLRLGRVLVLATPQQAADAQEIASRLGERSAGIYAGATMHTPVAVTEEAMQVVAERRVDGLVAVGGGSTTGLAKAIALRTDLPQIVAPTTYAGSEMTPILGDAGGRQGHAEQPQDPTGSCHLRRGSDIEPPAALSGTSGINAIAHAVEALYARDRNPVISLLATEAIRTLARSYVAAATHTNLSGAVGEANISLGFQGDRLYG